MNCKLLTILVTGFTLSQLVVSAPISLKTPLSIKLSKNEKEIVQLCLYYGIKAESASSKECFFPASFCNQLHDLESDSNTKPDLLSEREQAMRSFFYLEAKQLWSMYQQFSGCTLRTGDPKSCTVPNELHYKGLFLSDFQANKYQVAEHMAAAVEQVHPSAQVFEHCLHFHKRYPATFFMNSAVVPACERYAHAVKYFNLDEAEKMGVRSVSRFRIWWQSKLATQHHWLKFDNFSPITGVQEKPFSWANVESFAYQGLYTRSHDSFGRPGIEEPRSNLMKALQKDWNAPVGVANESLAFPGLRRLREHLESNMRADKAYDCLRFHAHEELPFCKGLTWAKEESDSKGKLLRTKFGDEQFLQRVGILVMIHELDDESKVAKVAIKYNLAFLNLPAKIVKHCRAHKTDKDCLDGGLYADFLK